MTGEQPGVERTLLPTQGRARVALNRTAWMPAPDLDLREWAEQGRRLGGIGRTVGWWIGDWLGYGNARFGERYARAAKITGYDTQTLMNMVYVASRFDASRRRERLSFSHHAELAALDVDAQEFWLSEAEEKRLSVRCLREALRRERKVLGGSEDHAARAALSRAQLAHELVCPECGCQIEKTSTESAAAEQPALAETASA